MIPRYARWHGLLGMRALGLALALFLAFAFSTTVQANEKVDVELVLAADGSGSIDDDEFKLQRQGYARAIAHPLVLNAIKGGEFQKIAVMYVEWGAPGSVETIVDWAVISDAASAKAFAAKVLKAPRKAFGYNSISAAIEVSTRHILTNKYDGKAKIIDISGDGPQLNGPSLPLVRAAALKAGITINAIAIKSRGGGSVRLRRGQPLEKHYERDVIGGPGSFVMVATEKTPFEEVILKKLIKEIAMLENAKTRH